MHTESEALAEIRRIVSKWLVDHEEESTASMGLIAQVLVNTKTTHPPTYPSILVGVDARFDQTGRQEIVEQNGNDGLPYCECHACIAEKDLKGPGGLFPLSSSKMILCPTCSNKRCPHASNHRLACTGSNEPGQPGSIYGETPLAELAIQQGGRPIEDEQAPTERRDGAPD